LHLQVLNRKIMRKPVWLVMPALASCILFLCNCAVNPVTGKKQLVLMSQSQEIAMGKQADPEVVAFFGLYDDPELQKFITEKGLEMAAESHRPKLAYEFKVVDSPVINAFAVPGGYVYFTRGIMAHFNNEAEFAGVLGHEIGHITARHSVIQQRNAMLGQLGLIAGVILVPELAEYMEPLSAGMQLALMSFGRDAERQSDKLGVEYSSRVGYDATEMAGFFETLQRQQAASGTGEIPNFLSTHPSPAERSKSVAMLATDWKKKLKLTDAEVNRESYLRKIDGIILGEDPRQGFTENGVFYHPELRFLFPVPGNWKLQNTPQMVQMAPENGEAVLMLTLAKGNSLEDAANQLLQRYKLNPVESAQETINGLPALHMVADQQQQQGTIRTLSTLIQYQNNIYSFIGVAELSRFTSYQPNFLFTAQNFKELTDGEKLNRKPDVVRIQTVPSPMTLEAALRHFSMPNDRLQELAILNGMDLNEPLSKGMLIKTIGR